MPENTNPEPETTENEDIEVVAHSEDGVSEAGCVVNNSAALS
jgi:hypothetical protein